MERCDQNAGGNYILSTTDRVQVEGHFVKDGVCVCLAVTTLGQSDSVPKGHVEWGSQQSLDWTGLVDWNGGLDWWTGLNIIFFSLMRAYQ